MGGEVRKERKKEKKRDIQRRSGIEREKRVIANTLYAREANHDRQTDDYSVDCPRGWKSSDTTKTGDEFL